MFISLYQSSPEQKMGMVARSMCVNATRNAGDHHCLVFSGLLLNSVYQKSVTSFSNSYEGTSALFVAKKSHL
jgi:hypothetical protein